MTEIIEHNKCCGCAACYSICGQEAITMVLDTEGFEYPIINQEKCIDCGLCTKVCPVLQYDKRSFIRKANNDIQTGFASRSINYEQRLRSSSGSIFPPIAEWIIEHGGIVVGVAYDEQWNVVHKIIDNKEDLIYLQGSKYLQCKADNQTFNIIKKELSSGRAVLYSAMACQIEALKSFLRKDYANLYTIDLICMGIPSYVVWQKYLETFFTNEQISAINFKEKSVGWDSFIFRVDTDKRIYKESGMQNLYLRSMFLSWNIRPSCFSCPFKKVERISDFTIADAWGVSQIVPEINDNKGLSSVIVHSSKGLRLWTEIKDKIESRNVSIDEISKGNSNLVSNKPMTGDRNLFYSLLERNPRKAFEKMCSVRNISIMRRILNKFRSLL